MSNKSTSTQNNKEQLEWSSKVLFRFDGRPDGIKDYLGHDVYRITDPKWLKFLESSKYELLDDDPTMIWEDSESHETWVLFDPERLRDGSHLNKTENQTSTYNIEIKRMPKGQEYGPTLKATTIEATTRLGAAIKALADYLHLPEEEVVKETSIDDETDEAGDDGSYVYGGYYTEKSLLVQVRKMVVWA